MKIAKFANECRLAAAIKHLTSELGHAVPKATIQTMRNVYHKKLDSVHNPP